MRCYRDQSTEWWEWRHAGLDRKQRRGLYDKRLQKRLVRERESIDCLLWLYLDQRQTRVWQRIQVVLWSDHHHSLCSRLRRELVQDEIQRRSSIEKDPWFSRVAAATTTAREKKGKKGCSELQERMAESHAHTQAS